MREFNKVSAKYWMTSLARDLKKLGSDALLLSIYLQTNHHTHSVGIFYLPIHYISHDIGITDKEVETLIKVLCESDFCRYDFEREYIWLKNFALEQSGGALKGTDNRIVQTQKYIQELPYLNFLEEFYLTHKDNFQLPESIQNLFINQCGKGYTKPLQSPSEEPSKPLQSTETKTETESETKTDTDTDCIVAFPRPRTPDNPIEYIFEHWKQIMNHPKAKLDNKRRRLILLAMQSGYDTEQLCYAITGCSYTAHNMGENDRGQRYDGLHVILSSADQIDRFIRNYHEPPKLQSKSMKHAKSTYNSLKYWVDGEEGTVHGTC